MDETAEGRALAELHFRKVWERHLVERGYEKPSREIGVTWRKVYTPVEAGEYLAKVQEGGGLGHSGSGCGSGCATGSGVAATGFLVAITGKAALRYSLLRLLKVARSRSSALPR